MTLASSKANVSHQECLCSKRAHAADKCTSRWADARPALQRLRHLLHRLARTRMAGLAQRVVYRQQICRVPLSLLYF